MKKHGYCTYMSTYISPMEKFLDFAPATRLSEVVLDNKLDKIYNFISSVWFVLCVFIVCICSWKLKSLPYVEYLHWRRTHSKWPRKCNKRDSDLPFDLQHDFIFILKRKKWIHRWCEMRSTIQLFENRSKSFILWHILSNLRILNRNKSQNESCKLIQVKWNCFIFVRHFDGRDFYEESSSLHEIQINPNVIFRVCERWYPFELCSSERFGWVDHWKMVHVQFGVLWIVVVVMLKSNCIWVVESLLVI